ncbi:hypothetical protein LOZ65_006418 [Ophidiomyces ophidiicola]|nr:hypothetical protein LOZ65_006418 [Ophidiomyces ophidiicola]
MAVIPPALVELAYISSGHRSGSQKRSFPNLTGSKRTSVALVVLIVIVIVLVSSLIVGLYCVARRHHRQKTRTKSATKPERYSETNSPIQVGKVEKPESSLTSPLLRSSDTTYRPINGAAQFDSNPPPHICFPPEAANNSSLLPPEPERRSLDLDVVTPYQLSIGATSVRHSFASDITSSVSSIIDKYRKLPGDRCYDSDNSAVTVRPQNQEIDNRNVFQSIDQSRSILRSSCDSSDQTSASPQDTPPSFSNNRTTPMTGKDKTHAAAGPSKISSNGSRYTQDYFPHTPFSMNRDSKSMASLLPRTSPPTSGMYLSGPHENAFQNEPHTNLLRFPLQDNCRASEQSCVDSWQLHPWPLAITPEEHIELRDFLSPNFPLVHNQPQSTTQSVHLELAPPRDSVQFEWKQKKRESDSATIRAHQNQPTEPAVDTDSNNINLSSNNSDTQTQSLSSDCQNSGSSREPKVKRKRRTRLYKLVKKILY